MEDLSSRQLFPFKNTAAFYQFSCFVLRSSPYTWSQQLTSNLFVPLGTFPATVHHRLIWYLTTLYEVCYTIFLFVTLYMHYEAYIAQEQFVAFVLHLIWLIGHCIISTIRVHQTWHTRELCHAFNSVYVFAVREIRSDHEFATRCKRRWWIYDKLMVLPFLVITGGAFSYATFVVFFPRHPRYWYLLVLGGGNPSSVELAWPLLSIFFVTEFTFIIGAWSTFFTESFFLVFIIDTMGLALKMLNRRKAKATATAAGKTQMSPIEIEIEALAKTFHEIKILNIMHQEGFGGSLGLPGLKLMTSMLALACISVGIRLGTRLHPILLVLLVFGALSCVGMLSLVMPLSAVVHEETFEFSFPNFHECACASGGSGNGSGGHRSIYSKKLVTSFKPYAIQISALYVIRRGTTLTFLSLFLTTLINILLTMNLYSVVDDDD